MPNTASDTIGTAFCGKNVLVTGGNTGIGLAVALAFAKSGAGVAIVGQNEKNNLKAIRRLSKVGSGKCRQLCIDLSQAPNCHQLISLAESTVGPLDILVNNAAHFSSSPLKSLSAEDVVYMFGVNTIAPLVCGVAFVESVTARRSRGVIVNISSISSILPFSDYGLYASTKAALNSLTRSMAIEWSKLGVRVNGVAPGHVHTESIKSDIQSGRLSMKKMTKQMPVGKIASPDQIADLILFLCSSRSSHICGQTIVIDGGQTSHL